MPRLAPLWQNPRGGPQFCVRRGRILQQIQNPQTIPAGKLHMLRSLDDRLGGAQGAMNNEIRQVGMVQRHCAQEQRFVFGTNPQRQPILSSTAILGMA